MLLAPLPLDQDFSAPLLTVFGVKLECAGCDGSQMYFLGSDSSLALVLSVVQIAALDDQPSLIVDQLPLLASVSLPITVHPRQSLLSSNYDAVVLSDAYLYVFTDDLYIFACADGTLLNTISGANVVQSLVISETLTDLFLLDRWGLSNYDLTDPLLGIELDRASIALPCFPSPSLCNTYSYTVPLFITGGPGLTYLVVSQDSIQLAINASDRYEFTLPNGFTNLLSIHWLYDYVYAAVFPSQLTLLQFFPLDTALDVAVYSGNFYDIFTVFTSITDFAFVPSRGFYISHGSAVSFYPWPQWDVLTASPPTSLTDAALTVTLPFQLLSEGLSGQLLLTQPISFPLASGRMLQLAVPTAQLADASYSFSDHCTVLGHLGILDTAQLLKFPSGTQLFPVRTILSASPLIRLRLSPVPLTTLQPSNVDLLHTDTQLPLTQIGGPKTPTFCRLVSQDPLQIPAFYGGSITNWYQAPSLQCIFWTPALAPSYSIFDVSEIFFGYSNNRLVINTAPMDIPNGLANLVKPYISSVITNTLDRTFVVTYSTDNYDTYLTLGMVALAPNQDFFQAFFTFGLLSECTDQFFLQAFDNYIIAVTSCPDQTLQVLDAGGYYLHGNLSTTLIDADTFGTVLAIGGSRQVPFLLITPPTGGSDPYHAFEVVFLDGGQLFADINSTMSVISRVSLSYTWEFLESHRQAMIFRRTVDDSVAIVISRAPGTVQTLPVTLFDECHTDFTLSGRLCGFYATPTGDQILVSNCSHVYLLLNQNQTSGYFPHLVTESSSPARQVLYASHLQQAIAVVGIQTYSDLTFQLFDVSSWYVEADTYAQPANYDFSLPFVTTESATPTETLLHIRLQGPPVLTGIPLQDQLVDVGAGFVLNVNLAVFSDPNSDPLITSASSCTQSNLPSWMTFNPTTSTFLGLPGANDIGTYCLSVSASDGISSGVATASFSLIVERFPIVVIPYPTQAVDVTARYPSVLTIPYDTFSDVEQSSDTLILTASGMPSWLTLLGWSFVASPTPSDIGFYKITLTATDHQGGSVSTVFTLAAEYFPEVIGTIPPQGAGILHAYRYVAPVALLFAPRNANPLTYSISTTLLPDGNTRKRSTSAASWLSFDPSSYTLSGTPLASDHGTVVVSLIASDSAAGASVITFNISVVYFPEALLGQITVPSASVNHPYSYAFPDDLFVDADTPSTALSYALDGEVPAWLAFDNATLTMFGTPSSINTGSYDLALVASDGFGTTPASFKLVVQVNLPPYVSNPLSNVDVSIGQRLSYYIPSTTFTDPNGDPLTFAITQTNNKPVPSWMHVNTTIPSITGTPSISDIPSDHLGFLVGPYVVHLRVTASDGSATAVATVDVSISGISAVEWALIAILIFFGPAIVIIALYLIRHYFWYLFCRRRYLKMPITRSAYERSLIELSGHDLYPIQGYDEGLFTKMEIYLFCGCVCCRFRGKSYPWCKKKINRGEVKRIKVEVRDPRGFGGDRIPHDVQCWDCCMAMLTCCCRTTSRPLVPPPTGFPAVRRSERAQWWGNARLKDMNRRSLPNHGMPEWLSFDRHLNALIIEPKHLVSAADLEDEYYISIIGNDKRVRAEFRFTFETQGQSSQPPPSKLIRDLDEEHDSIDCIQGFQLP